MKQAQQNLQLRPDNYNYSKLSFNFSTFSGNLTHRDAYLQQPLFDVQSFRASPYHLGWSFDTTLLPDKRPLPVL